METRQNCEYCKCGTGFLVWAINWIRGNHTTHLPFIGKYRCDKCGRVWWA